MVQKNIVKTQGKGKFSSKPTAPPHSRAANRHPASPSVRQESPYETRNLQEQQRLLDVFQQAFNAVLRSDDFTSLLQEVKGALYDRDFSRAFGRKDYLQVYAARWSPPRALCYASIFARIKDHIDDSVIQDEPTPDAAQHSRLQVLAIGGGTAEIAAFAYFLSKQERLIGAITLLDVAPWKDVVEELRECLTTPPPLSKYASASAKASNKALLDPARLRKVTVDQQDVLSLSAEQFVSTLQETANVMTSDQTQAPILATCFFTLNELYTSGGVGKTTTFLLQLTAALPRGSFLLVVDSPGSYSETTVGGEARKYPMAWVTDKILLGTGWTKVLVEDDTWLRLSHDQLAYPIALEDMRYQLHLYRREGEDPSNGDMG